MSSILALWTSVAVAFGGPVKEVRIAPGANTTEVVVAVDGVVEVRDFMMEAPNRLFVDLVGARFALDRETYSDIGRGGVVSLAASQYSDDVVRLVIELEDKVAYDVFSQDGGILIALENSSGEFAPWTSGMGRAPVSAPVETRAAARPARQESERMTIEFANNSIEDVIFAFAEFSGRSIILGNGVEGVISAKIENQPWQEALDAILQANGFVAEEGDTGIIRVLSGARINELESTEPALTRTYPVNYVTADEIAQALTGVLQDGSGQAAPVPGSNAVVVTAIARIHNDVQKIIEDLDVRTPSVNIQAKIIFVNRTDLNELGITYDLKDSQGNQLNLIAPGASDVNNDGVISLPEEVAPQGGSVVSLGGNSIAALGNANNRLTNPTIQLLSSLVVGRHTLVNFIEALESSNLSDVQAEPYQTVLNNQQARIQVGERTPLRVIDAGGIGAAGAAGAGGAGAGGAGVPNVAQAPQATVQFEETGIILEATPTVTNNGEIILQLSAERSAPQLGESDVGLIFNTQNARSRVLVRDGETVVIGGLTVTELNEIRSGVPMLMNLPLVGRLFRTTRRSLVQRDLIILVTPTIVRGVGN